MAGKYSPDLVQALNDMLVDIQNMEADHKRLILAAKREAYNHALELCMASKGQGWASAIKDASAALDNEVNPFVIDSGVIVTLTIEDIETIRCPLRNTVELLKHMNDQSGLEPMRSVLSKLERAKSAIAARQKEET